ncbi:hypothetical protein [Ewingella americana]|uniref:hypothetical protein n=1 Tax=Ewingella americana TaxID=41202 RepID=UPI0012AD5D40|nr:hypothetical protein [Ewingella americana]MRT03212.1 hypothetical protein [Ewingella americana]
MQIAGITRFAFSRLHYRKTLLASLIFNGLFICAETARAQGQVVITKGGEVTLSEALIETYEDNKIAVSVQDTNSIATLTDTQVVTKGQNASGLSAINHGQIYFDGGSITTTNATAVEVKSGGSITLNSADVLQSAFVVSDTYVQEELLNIELLAVN